MQAETTVEVAETVLANCRICHDEDDLKNLDTPCACSGSIKYAQRSCVQRWCTQKRDTICEICRQPYKDGYNAPPRFVRTQSSARPRLNALQTGSIGLRSEQSQLFEQLLDERIEAWRFRAEELLDERMEAWMLERMESWKVRAEERMEALRLERIETWRALSEERLEAWRAGQMEVWRVRAEGRMEAWRLGQIETWKVLCEERVEAYRAGQMEAGAD